MAKIKNYGRAFFHWMKGKLGARSNLDLISLFLFHNVKGGFLGGGGVGGLVGDGEDEFVFGGFGVFDVDLEVVLFGGLGAGLLVGDGDDGVGFDA